MINEELIEFELKTFDEKIKRIENKQECFNQELKDQREMLNDFDKTQQLILQKLDTIIDTIDGLKAEHAEERKRPCGRKTARAKNRRFSRRKRRAARRGISRIRSQGL
jgi:hypothetical protein